MSPPLRTLWGDQSQKLAGGFSLTTRVTLVGNHGVSVNVVLFNEQEPSHLYDS